jgi:hypothetical protein
MMYYHMFQYLIIYNNNNNNNFEIISDVQFTSLDDLYYDMWPNVNMPHDILKWI